MFHFKTEKELRDFIKTEGLTTPEALEILGISRQGLKDLVYLGKIEPIKETERMKLFLRSEIPSERT